MKNLNVPVRLSLYMILFLWILGQGKLFASSVPMVDEKKVLNQTNITGFVTDIDGNPLVGVSVSVKGTSQATSSSVDGQFILNNVSKDAILVFSYVGYLVKEIETEGRSEISITLLADTKILDDVVIIGYQSVRREDVSVAIASVSEKDIQDIPVINASQALAGKISGVTFQQTSGAPGAAPAIRVRGSGSISNGNNPLYVIDGYPTSDAGLFNAIPPSDIESIDVLKDAAAAAIYGSRAGNGVILVTTKGGKQGSTKLTMDIMLGEQSLTKKYEMMNAVEYVEMAKEALNNQGMAIPEIFNEPNQWVTTDWQDAIFQNAGFQNYQLGASGGNESVQFSVTGGYANQNGIIRNSWFKRYNGRVKLDARLNPKLRAGVNILPTFTEAREQQAEGVHNSTGKDGIIAIALSMPPIIPILQPNGDYTNPIQHYDGVFNTQLSNPVQKLDANLEYRRSVRMSGNFYLEYEPITDLKIRSTFSSGISGEKYEHYIEPYMAWNGNGTGNISTPNLSVINATRRNGLDMNWYLSNTLTYRKTILENHNFTFLLGYDVSKQNNFNTTITPRTDADNPIAFTNSSIKNVMGATLRQGSSGKNSYSFDALFARLIYSLHNKYTLTTSIRQDRSSRFGPSARSGIFPSVSAAWRVSEEAPFKSIHFISDLKLRASYGVTGNDQLSGYYPWLSTLSQSFYVFGRVDNAVRTMVPAAFSNPELNWEKNIQTDIGLDISFLKNRINLTIDWYDRNSNSILAAGIPSINGIANSVLTNLGNVRNRGTEFAVFSQNLTGKFKWNTNFNISFNNNEITSLGANQTKLGDLAGGPWANVVRNYVGRPMGDLYLYNVVGTFNSQEDLDNYPKLGSQSIGDLRFKDINGDNVITTDDMTLVGNYQPDFTYGFTNRIAYGSFDFSVTLQGAQGGKIINSMERQLALVRSTENSNKAALNRWKSENDPGDGLNHVAGTPNLGTNIGPSTRFLYNASFLRVRDVTLSYLIPGKIIDKIGVQQVRMYVTGHNLLTFTEYSGYNPEGNLYGNSAIRNGIDQGTYPVSRNISIGLNMSF